MVVLLLPACTSGTAGRDLHSELHYQVTPDGCGPRSVDVPAGIQVQVRVTNETRAAYQWAFMKRPVFSPFYTDPAGVIDPYVVQAIPSASETTFTFTTPQAAGVYDVVCGDLGQVTPDMLLSITVVQE
ncbi:MAG: hypothetical protein GYA17_01000 [Chloroflexi bacterium]|nr:hypothetical protein [Chloroflexota bacterium]